MKFWNTSHNCPGYMIFIGIFYIMTKGSFTNIYAQFSLLTKEIQIDTRTTCVFTSKLAIIFSTTIHIFPSKWHRFSTPQPILHLLHIKNKIKFPLSTKKNNWDQFSSQLTFPRNLSSISLILSCHFSSILFLPIYTNIVLILYQQNMWIMYVLML